MSQFTTILTFIVFFGLQAAANDYWTQSFSQPPEKTSQTHNNIINSNSLHCMQERAKTYYDRTSVDIAFLNMFPADNKAETYQNRYSLDKLNQILNYDIFDMVNNKRLNWQKENCTNGLQFTDNSHLLAVHKSYHESNSPVLLYFVSNTHVLQDIILQNTGDYLAERGITFVVMEYPGYGGSLGLPSKKTWVDAGVNSVDYLKSIDSNRPVYLFGHSIGAAVAYSVAASKKMKALDGVITFAGIESVTEQAKDQKGFGPQWMKVLVAMALFGNDGYDFSKDVKSITSPTLVLHGTEDKSVPVRHAELIKKQVEGSKIVGVEFIEGANHEALHDPNSEHFELIWNQTLDFIDQQNR